MLFDSSSFIAVPLFSEIEKRRKHMGFPGMKSKAEKTEAAILARLSGQEGVTILLPFGGGNGRYDMVIDDHGTFYRVQCKTGRLEQNGSVVFFNAASSTYHYYGEKAVNGGTVEGRLSILGCTALKSTEPSLSLSIS
jgi:hypothetical protein